RQVRSHGETQEIDGGAGRKPPRSYEDGRVRVAARPAGGVGVVTDGCLLLMQPLLLALALSFQPVPLDSESTYDLKSAKLEGKWSTVGGVPYKIEPRGLRVTAAGKPGADVEGGATLAVAIFNDFEIIVGYELLGPARPASGSGAGALLAVGTASTPQTLARFARLSPPTGASGLFTAVGAAGGKEIANPVAADASSRKGRLKLNRRLSTLTFSHAEGDQTTFKTIRETTFVKADVSSLSLLARGAGGAGADVLFTDLVVRTAPPPGSTIVQTIHDRRIAGPLVSVEGGKLRIGAVPPRDFDLSDLAQVEIGSGAALRPRWVGQVDKDFVGTTARRGKNGIQDVQLVLSGLASGKEIVQVRLTVETPDKPAIYMLDTTKGPGWRLDLQRTGLSSAADVYLEPYEGDMFGRPITVAVTYSDGLTGSGSCKATTPTDHKRKIGAAAVATTTKAGAPPPRMRAVVHLSSGDKLSGEIAKWDEKGVTLAPEWGGEILLPTDSLAALRPLPAIALVDKDFEERRKSPLAEDVAFVKNREEKLDNVAGKAVGFADGKLRFLYQGQERSLAAPRVLAVVFGARPKPRAAFDAYQSFELASGDLVTGKWLGMADGRQRIAATWNPNFNLPSES
ncbi:MAG TPA: hypothetical protein VNC50_14695, partial [Planctomycetia bacterium]|nr:hypothetical protein [Planctomycetia bacterium]